MHKINKGDISKTYVAAKLMELEYDVLNLMTENSRYDLAIDVNGKMKRIQVKSVYMNNSKNKYELYFYSTQPKKGKKKSLRYTKEEVDYIIGYNQDTKKYYVFPISAVHERYSMVIDETNTISQKYLDAFWLLQ